MAEKTVLTPTPKTLRDMATVALRHEMPGTANALVAAADAWQADLDKITELDAALRIVTVAADKVVGA